MDLMDQTLHISALEEEIDIDGATEGAMMLC
jgi:hypothetical protein